jgi:DNA-binding MurR/RpiR family transcriptional regulator
MLSRISHAIPDLSRSEKRVAAWVIEHPKEAASVGVWA